MTDTKNKIDRNRQKELEQSDHLSDSTSDDQQSFVYDILSEGNALLTKQRPRAYSLHSGKCSVARVNVTKERTVRQRRMSLPANEVRVRIQKDRPGNEQQSKLMHFIKIDEIEDETQNDSFRDRRARSFKERSSKDGENLRRVRSFKTTSRGLVNRGDTYAVKDDKDSVKKDEYNKEKTMATLKVCFTNIPRQGVMKTEDQKVNFKVLLSGARGVGKSSIIDQFMTSDFLGCGSFNISQSEGDRTVTLQVDGEESTLEFVQSEDFEDQEESFQIDAFVVVYCITERQTFDIAIDLLKQIREEVGTNKAIILVANKSDLVRKRTISQEEGRSAADAYGCKYIELSAALNHRVDELLVGIHKQIRLKSDAETEEVESKVAKTKDRKSSFKRTKRFLEKVFLGHSGKDKKTENLYVE